MEGRDQVLPAAVQEDDCFDANSGQFRVPADERGNLAARDRASGKAVKLDEHLPAAQLRQFNSLAGNALDGEIRSWLIFDQHGSSPRGLCLSGARP
jgi:hypothetical protein